MKRKIWIKRRDNVRQRYLIGRTPKKNYGSKALRRITPKNLFRMAGEDVLRPRKLILFGKHPKQLLKEYPELIPLVKSQKIKYVGLNPIITDSAEEEKLKKRGNVLLGRFFPDEKMIGVAIAPYSDHMARSSEELADTLFHEIRHAEQEDLPIFKKGRSSEKEVDAEEYAIDKLSEHLVNKKTEEERKRKAMERIFQQ